MGVASLTAYLASSVTPLLGGSLSTPEAAKLPPLFSPRHHQLQRHLHLQKKEKQEETIGKTAKIYTQFQRKRESESKRE